MPLSAEAETQIKAILDNAVSNGGVPGLAFCAIDKSGNYLTKQVAGNIGAATNTPVTLDTIFWIASCTKAITGVACMQLAEQGKLDLDSSDQLYKVCPELKAVKVLNDKGELEDKQKEITVRMLLTHTSGFGYSLFNEKIIKFDELSADPKQYHDQPLINQPGKRWEYGISIDWAGITVERVSGLSLDEYFKKNIFEPLGMKSTTFFPNEDMRKHMVKSHQRDASGYHEHPAHVYGHLANATDEQKKHFFQSGGAGCFSKPTDYCLFLATLLNDGTSPNTGAKILEKKTVDEMFTNQIPELPNFGREPLPNVKPEAANAAPEIYPQPGDPPQGWGLSFFITIEPGVTGRGPNTGWWAGIANLFYWADRSKGVAGMIAGQIMPFGDPDVLGAWFGVEAAIYSGLQ